MLQEEGEPRLDLDVGRYVTVLFSDAFLYLCFIRFRVRRDQHAFCFDLQRSLYQECGLPRSCGSNNECITLHRTIRRHPRCT